MSNYKERDLFSVRPAKKQGKSANKKKFIPKKELKENVKVDYEDFHADCITYDNVCEGHIMLGCILEIRKYELVMSLPNRMVGYVPITNISHAYKKLLSKISEEQELAEKLYDLSELYNVGQLLNTKVKTILTTHSDKKKVILSLMPSDTNINLNASLLQTGSILQGAISGEEEKGFVIETGIINVRAAFMPKGKTPSGTLGVGNVFLCCVRSVMDSEDGQVRIKLSASPSFMAKHIVSLDDATVAMTTITPGVRVRTTVLRTQKEGLVLKTHHNKAFVSANHLRRLDHSPKDYQSGSEVLARVLFITDFTNSLHCSLNENICESDIIKDPMGDIKVGDIVENAEIYKSGKEGVHLRLPNDRHGFCSANRLQDSFIDSNKISERYPVGSCKNCRIIHANLIDQLFVVSLQKSLLSGEIFGVDDLSVGQKLKVKIMEHNNYGAVVQLSPTVNGFVLTMHLTDTGVSCPELKRPVGQSFSARIIRHVPGQSPRLTLKKDLVKTALPIVTDLNESNVGITTVGTVARHYNSGFLVEFFGEAKAFVPLREIPLNCRGNFSEEYTIGTVIQCRIVSVDKANNKMTASLLSKDTSNTKDRKTNPVDLKVTDTVRCVVSHKKDDKVFVDVKNHGNVKAFIPKYELNDDVIQCKLSFKGLKKGKMFRRAIVIQIDDENVVLSLKSEHFKPKNASKHLSESFDEIQVSQSDISSTKIKEKTKKRKTDDDSCSSSQQETSAEAKLNSIKERKTKVKGNSEASVDEDGSEGKKRKRLNSSQCLPVASCAFDWTGQELQSNNIQTEVSSSSDEDEDIQSKEKEKKSVRKLNRSERQQLYNAAEKKTRELELQRLDTDRQPETTYDFEEKIERTPHSANAWIEYVSFHLENAETEKARSVVSRALTIIPSHLEDERLSIWNVLLRLEVMYGTQSSVESAFKEALVTNDELEVYYIMMEIYRTLNKFKEAEDVVKTMTKKFSQNKEVWIRAGMLFYQCKNLSAARSMMDKSLTSLPKQDHVDVINRFAQYEMKFGDPERSRTIFETLLTNYPKRLDIWHVYADLLTKRGDIPEARNVLERMTGLKIRLNAMRGVFKKLLEFEKSHGTPQRVEAVKARVEEFVAAAIKTTAE